MIVKFMKDFLYGGKQFNGYGLWRCFNGIFGIFIFFVKLLLINKDLVIWMEMHHYKAVNS